MPEKRLVSAAGLEFWSHARRPALRIPAAPARFTNATD
jgi:hypothetical protein